MQFEARITVHQEGTQKPDYNDIHDRLATAGYQRVRSIGGYNLHELHGMYSKVSLKTIDAERSGIEQALRSAGFRFSIELFHITETRTFNLEPAPNYGALLGMLGKR